MISVFCVFLISTLTINSANGFNKPNFILMNMDDVSNTCDFIQMGSFKFVIILRIVHLDCGKGNLGNFCVQIHWPTSCKEIANF